MSETSQYDEVLKRLERLEAAEQIRHLKHRTAIAADPYMDMEMLIDQYTDDGIMEITTFGLKLNGKDEIREFLKVNAFTWMFHCLVPLRVEVSEDCLSANARWYLLEAATVHNGATGNYDPVWLAGSYEDAMVRENGEWKLKHTVLDIQLLCEYSEGWGGERVNVNKNWVGKAQSLQESLNSAE